MTSVEIVRDGKGEPWAQCWAIGWRVSFFADGDTILAFRAPDLGSVTIHFRDEDVVARGPEVARLLGLDLNAETIACAIAACRAALAERALAELKVAEEMARAGAGA